MHLCVTQQPLRLHVLLPRNPPCRSGIARQMGLRGIVDRRRFPALRRFQQSSDETPRPGRAGRMPVCPADIRVMAGTGSGPIRRLPSPRGLQGTLSGGAAEDRNPTPGGPGSLASVRLAFPRP